MSPPRPRITSDTLSSAFFDYCRKFGESPDAIHVPENQRFQAGYLIEFKKMRLEIIPIPNSFPWFLRGDHGNLVSDKLAKPHKHPKRDPGMAHGIAPVFQMSADPR